MIAIKPEDRGIGYSIRGNILIPDPEKRKDDPYEAESSYKDYINLSTMEEVRVKAKNLMPLKELVETNQAEFGINFQGSAGELKEITQNQELIDAMLDKLYKKNVPESVIAGELSSIVSSEESLIKRGAIFNSSQDFFETMQIIDPERNHFNTKAIKIDPNSGAIIDSIVSHGLNNGEYSDTTFSVKNINGKIILKIDGTDLAKQNRLSKIRKHKPLINSPEVKSITSFKIEPGDKGWVSIDLQKLLEGKLSDSDIVHLAKVVSGEELRKPVTIIENETPVNLIISLKQDYDVSENREIYRDGTKLYFKPNENLKHPYYDDTPVNAPPVMEITLSSPKEENTVYPYMENSIKEVQKDIIKAISS
ncbi:MAG: hypothetical protein HRT47_08665 [Candidatus Caenarcaniphilales bacterium]|nr:hypothetical protein [Candidatus Caenarcaniphilales bacterium]